MRKNLLLIGLFGLFQTVSGLARPVPAPIVIHGERPTTASLRTELLEENVPLYLHNPEFHKGASNVRFATVYDRLTRLSTYYDSHLLQDLNRTDNPFGHNQPGFGINF